MSLCVVRSARSQVEMYLNIQKVYLNIQKVANITTTNTTTTTADAAAACPQDVEVACGGGFGHSAWQWPCCLQILHLLFRKGFHSKWRLNLGLVIKDMYFFAIS